MKHLPLALWYRSIVCCWLLFNTASAVEVDQNGNRTAEQRLRDMSAQQAAEGLEMSARARRAEHSDLNAKLDALSRIGSTSAFALSPEEIARIDAWKKVNDQDVARRNAEAAEHNMRVAVQQQARHEANVAVIKSMFQRILPPGKREVGRIDPKDYVTAAAVAESLITGEFYNTDIADYMAPGDQFYARLFRAQQLYLAIPPEYFTEKSNLYAFRALADQAGQTVEEYRILRSQRITGAHWFAAEKALKPLFMVLASALASANNELPEAGQRELGIALFSQLVDEIHFAGVRAFNSPQELDACGCLIRCATLKVPELARCQRDHDFPLGSSGKSATERNFRILPKPESVLGFGVKNFPTVPDDHQPLIMTDMWSHAWWNLAVSLVLADATQYPGPWFCDIRNERRAKNTRPPPAFVKATVQKALDGWFLRNHTSPDVRQVIQADCDLACAAEVRDLEPYVAWDNAPRHDERAEDPRRPEWVDPVLANLLTRVAVQAAIQRIQNATGWKDGTVVNRKQRAALFVLLPDIQNITDPALVRALAHMGVCNEDWAGLAAWLGDPRRRPTGTTGDRLYDDYQHALSEVKDTREWLADPGNVCPWETALATLDESTRQWLQHVQAASGATRDELVATYLKTLVQPGKDDETDHMRRFRWIQSLAPLARRESPVAAAAQAAILDLIDRNEVNYDKTSPDLIRAQIMWERAKLNKQDDRTAFAAAEAVVVDKEDLAQWADCINFVALPLNPDPNLLRTAQNNVSIFPAIPAPQVNSKATSP